MKYWRLSWPIRKTAIPSGLFTLALSDLKDACRKFAQCQLESDPRLLYLPGNHDRLVNKYSSLRVEVCKCLGIPPNQHNPAEPFPHEYQDLPYGVFARHGHEFDKFNYEGGTSFDRNRLSEGAHR